MFTGIVTELGRVSSLRRSGSTARLTIEAPETAVSCRVGDSVAVNGVCLTAARRVGALLSFDLATETLRVTDLGELAAGGRVNLEPALAVGDRLGGHFVTGHVDGVGHISRRHAHGDSLEIEISAPAAVLAITVHKGSIAVDGVSLTAAELRPDGFRVAIIPHTAAITTLGFKKPGDSVNLEADLLGKYVARLLTGDRTGAVRALGEPLSGWLVEEG